MLIWLKNESFILEGLENKDQGGALFRQEEAEDEAVDTKRLKELHRKEPGHWSRNWK